MGQTATRDAKMARRPSHTDATRLESANKRAKLPPLPPAQSPPSPSPTLDVSRSPARQGYSSSPKSPLQSSSRPSPTAAASHASTGVAGGSASSVTSSSVPLGSSVPKEAPKNPAMPIVFRWTHGGRKVYITGTFNGWMQRIPLNKSGDDFAAILNLPEGLHSYRYIVDDEWRVDPDQPTHVDNGVINNYVDVEDFPKLTGGHGLGQNKLGASSEPEIYAHEHHRFEVSKKYPPHLPPHLRYTPLNCDPHPVDPVLLPMPQHVTLNHCYFSVVGEQADVLAMGVTHRYRHKFSTVVLYKPMDVAGDGTEDMILDDDLVV